MHWTPVWASLNHVRLPRVDELSIVALDNAPVNITEVCPFVVDTRDLRVVL